VKRGRKGEKKRRGKRKVEKAKERKERSCAVGICNYFRLRFVFLFTDDQRIITRII